MMWIVISSTFASGGQAHLEQLEGLVNLVMYLEFISLQFGSLVYIAFHNHDINIK